MIPKETTPSLAIGRHMNISKSIQNLSTLRAFWNPDRHKSLDDTRDNAIQTLMRITGASKKTLDAQSWDEHTLLWHLHLVGNDTMVKDLAQNAQAMKTHPTVRNLLLKSVAWRIEEDENLQTLTNVDPNVITVVRRTIAKNKKAWKDEWQNELKSLHERPIIGF